MSAELPASDPTPDPERDEILDSWKDIANLLGVTVRRAQRWEQDKGLPVGRLNLGPKKTIHARRSEILEWQRSRLITPDHASRPQAPLPPDSAPVKTTPSTTQPGRRWGRPWLAAGLLGVAAVAVAVIIALIRSHSPGVSGAVPVETAVLASTQLKAFGARGNLLWERPLGELTKSMRSDAIGPMKAGDYWRSDTTIVADMNGDGANDVVAVVTTAMPWNDQVLVFDGRGNELWRFAPGRPLTWGERRFDNHYVVNWVMGPVLVDGRRLLVVSASNEFFPCQITLLDSGTGTMVGEFWHPGMLESGLISDVDSDGRPDLVLGGFNNPGPGSGRPVLAVLSLPFGRVSSQDEAPFFPALPHPEDRYYVFPSVDVLELVNRPFGVSQLYFDSPDRLHAVVSVGRRFNTMPQLHYQLSPALAVLGVEPCDLFRGAHLDFQHRGLLNHALTPTEQAQWTALRSFRQVPNANMLPKVGR
jgi:hypothetical protein